MKLLLLFGILISQLTYSQVNGLKTVIEKEADLFYYSEVMNFDKDPAEIHDENMKMIKLFTDEVMDISPRNYREARNISADAVYDTLNHMRRNPVVSLYQYNKYDPENEGIGFCFGRAMFANMHLVAKGIERDHIKKAFVIGHMETPDGASWGWHVATIARTERVNAKNEIVEDWYVVDPIVGYPMYITDWYNYMRDDFSVDGKLRIWFTEPAKFGPSQNSYYTEQYIKHSSFNNYFTDMMEWFENAFAEEGSIYDQVNWYTNFKPQVRKVIPMSMDEE